MNGALDKIDQLLAGVQEQKKPTSGNLLDWANQNHFRVTSGFSTHGHSPNSRHYQGTAKDPEAIDIDHRGVDLANLKRLAAQNNYTLLDEVNHPSKWSTGPHYHLQKGAPLSRAHESRSAVASMKPTAKASLSSGIGRPIGQPLGFDSQGVLRALPENLPDTASVVRKASASAIPAPVKLPDSTAHNAQPQSGLDAIDHLLSQVGQKQKTPVKSSAKPETNFFGDFYNNAINAASGYTQDDLVRNSGQGWGAAGGNAVGGLLHVAGGALAGAGIGTVVPVLGTVSGAVGGSIAGAGEAGTLQALQNQRLSGQKQDIVKALGAGAIQAGLQAIPVVKGASLLGTIAKNAALQGGGAAVGSVGQQAIEQGTLTPKLDTRRIISEAGLGAAGGTVGAGIEHKFGGGHAATRELDRPSAFRDAADADRVYQSATQERLNHDKQIAKKYKTQEAFENRLSELEQKIQARSATPKEYQEHQQATALAERQQALRQAADTANQASIEANTPAKRAELFPKEEPPRTTLTPEEQRLANPEYAPRGEAPNAEELKASFEQRTRPEQKELFDPRKQAVPEELGTYKTEPSEGGIEIATRAGQREPKELDLPSSYSEKQKDVFSSPTPRAKEIGASGLLDAHGSPISKPGAGGEILTPGRQERAQPKELELPPSYRKEEVPQAQARPAETPAAEAVSTVSNEPKQGSFVDAINELLKDSGTDYEGVRSLKAEMDRLTEVSKTGGTAGRREAKAQLKDLKERWKAVPENIRELAGSEFDPETGIGRQREVNPEAHHTLERVRGDLDSHVVPIAERINEAMQKGTRVRLKYVAEEIGRSNEVAKQSKGGRAVVEGTEFSPTHFGYLNATYADGKRSVPAVFGYNQRGHRVKYYLNKSPKGSHVQQVLSVTDKPAFRGATANVYHGPGDYNVADVLARGPRTERGFVKTSEAIRAIHEQQKAVREAAMRDAGLSPSVKSKVENVFSGQELSYDDIRAMRKELSEPSKLAEICKHMGLS